MSDDIDAPHPDDYRERVIKTHLDATKELLAWSRSQGFRFEEAVVGDSGITLTGIVDDYPRAKVYEKPAPVDDVEDGSAYAAAVEQYGERPPGPR